MNKRGQIKISFGMIFSIILIIVFIAAAIFGIGKFLSLQTSINTKQFVNNLQSEVDNIWNSGPAVQAESYSVPSSVAKVCFEKSSSANLIFITDKNSVLDTGTIEHLNMTAMFPDGKSRVCFNSTENKVSFTLQKKFRETLVTIK